MRPRTGPVAALMDEYERAMLELLHLVERLTDEEYERPRDPQAEDASCRSIQTVLTHVVSAGYGYAGMMRAAWELPARVHDRRDVTRAEAVQRMREVLAHTEATLEGHWDLTEAGCMAMRMTSRWGQVYDFEQIFEHAIVHVLRHRRQVERWLARDG